MILSSLNPVKGSDQRCIHEANKYSDWEGGFMERIYAQLGKNGTRLKSAGRMTGIASADSPAEEI